MKMALKIDMGDCWTKCRREEKEKKERNQF